MGRLSPTAERHVGATRRALRRFRPRGATLGRWNRGAVMPSRAAMPNFLEDIVAQLKRADSRVVLREIHGEEFVSVSGRELLEQVQRVRAHLRGKGLQPGERCALLAANSARWVAFNLALLAEGIIIVPLYARQAPAELAAMMKDCVPRFLFASDRALGEPVAKALPPQWSIAGRLILFDEVLEEVASPDAPPEEPNPRADAD